MAIVTVKPSGGDFTTLNGALSDINTAPGDNIQISEDWTSATDTAAATVADANLTIEALGDAQWLGGGEPAKNYKLVVSLGAHALTVNASGCTIRGFIVHQASTTSSAECFRIAAAVTFQKMRARCTTNTSNQDCWYSSTGGITITCEQCVAIDAGRTGFLAQNVNSGTTLTYELNSSAAWGNGRHATSGQGGVAADRGQVGNSAFNIHNTWMTNNDSRGADYREYGGTTGAATWGISYSIDGDNSIASRDAGGVGNLASRTVTDNTSPGAGDWIIVEDATSSPYNFGLVDNAENDAQDAHAVATAEGLTIPSADVAGTSRPQNTDHDIGHFEIAAAGGGVPKGSHAMQGVGI